MYRAGWATWSAAFCEFSEQPRIIAERALECDLVLWRSQQTTETSNNEQLSISHGRRSITQLDRSSASETKGL